MSFKKGIVFSGGAGKCAYCKTTLLASDNRHDRSATIDHIHPLSMGGTDAVSNLIPCCKKCNTMKTDFSIHEMYLLRLGLCTIQQLLSRRNRKKQDERSST